MKWSTKPRHIAALGLFTVRFQTYLLIGFGIGVGIGVALGAWFGWLGFVTVGTYLVFGCLLHWWLGWRDGVKSHD